MYCYKRTSGHHHQGGTKCLKGLFLVYNMHKGDMYLSQKDLRNFYIYILYVTFRREKCDCIVDKNSWNVKVKD